MQMVAAAKLRRAQMAAEEARPYSQRMAKVLSNISNAMGGREGVSPLIAGNGSDQVHLLVVATAERGLCGGFNSSIAKIAREKARQLRSEGKEVKLYMVGKKGVEALRMEFSNIMVEKIDFREVIKIKIRFF